MRVVKRAALAALSIFLGMSQFAAAADNSGKTTKNNLADYVAAFMYTPVAVPYEMARQTIDGGKWVAKEISDTYDGSFGLDGVVSRTALAPAAVALVPVYGVVTGAWVGLSTADEWAHEK